MQQMLAETDISAFIDLVINKNVSTNITLVFTRVNQKSIKNIYICDIKKFAGEFIELKLTKKIIT